MTANSQRPDVSVSGAWAGGGADAAAADVRGATWALKYVVQASFKLPAGVSLTIIESYHGSTPYNVTSGTDPAGLGLYSFRAGRLRNSGNGPGFDSVSVYGSRRIALPIPGGSSRIWADVGLHVENLLNHRNYVAVGSVAGSPLLGVPLVGLPGRSLRVTVSFDR